jgi:hypothetical protein
VLHAYNSMNRDYDIFEKLPDGSVVWRAFVPGLENARAKLQNSRGTQGTSFSQSTHPRRKSSRA